MILTRLGDFVPLRKEACAIEVVDFYKESLRLTIEVCLVLVGSLKMESLALIFKSAGGVLRQRM